MLAARLAARRLDQERNRIEQARARFALPITAIGGVGLDNGAELISRGADLLAVVHALFSAPSATEVEARARAFGALFTAS